MSFSGVDMAMYQEALLYLIHLTLKKSEFY